MMPSIGPQIGNNIDSLIVVCCQETQRQDNYSDHLLLRMGDHVIAAGQVTGLVTSLSPVDSLSYGLRSPSDCNGFWTPAKILL